VAWAVQVYESAKDHQRGTGAPHPLAEAEGERPHPRAGVAAHRYGCAAGSYKRECRHCPVKTKPECPREMRLVVQLDPVAGYAALDSTSLMFTVTSRRPASFAAPGDGGGV